MRGGPCACASSSPRALPPLHAAPAAGGIRRHAQRSGCPGRQRSSRPRCRNPGSGMVRGRTLRRWLLNRPRPRPRACHKRRRWRSGVSPVALGPRLPTDGLRCDVGEGAEDRGRRRARRRRGEGSAWRRRRPDPRRASSPRPSARGLAEPADGSRPRAQRAEGRRCKANCGWSAAAPRGSSPRARSRASPVAPRPRGIRAPAPPGAARPSPRCREGSASPPTRCA
mmetsp:Transcript_133337/g.385914  ORF Transcript_133337/g.385914 Transcript_133337/m.385914 type:complete len:225 (-) Transcript_133337:279-953(-)